MKITNLKIKNFRGFEDESIDFDDITVFVGENNTGKTTILDAIRFVIGAKSFNSNFLRYDYHLNSQTAKAGDAGNIVLTVEVSEQQENEWPPEIQQILPDCVDIDGDGLCHFYLTVKGAYSQDNERSEQTKEFQTKTGAPKNAKTNTSHYYGEFRKLLPIFHIDTIRDSNKEFQNASGLFQTFLNSETIVPEQKINLEQKLESLNREIISVLGSINKLKDKLKQSMSVIAGSDTTVVDIDPVPTNINELIGKATVLLQSITGVKLPLERFGSGAQSLAVLFLYEAFLSVLLEEKYDRFSEPILLIEEPEAHLHPSAVRLFWHFLEAMPGQKIITTHSGDILASVPFSKIRRIVGLKGINRIKQMSETSLDEQEKRVLRNYIKYSRGELFFAKCWLLVEGETEQIFFENLLNIDGFLDKKGIRIIQFPQLSLDVILKLAESLCIRWYLVSDGDPAGQVYNQKAVNAIPTGTPQDDYIFIFTESTLEVNLMLNGFENFYIQKLTAQTKPRVQGTIGTLPYYESVYNALKKSISKPQTILEIVDAVITNPASNPDIIKNIRTKLETIL
jgi:putative ATP-dependent endonuclease of OLD family